MNGRTGRDTAATVVLVLALVCAIVSLFYLPFLFGPLGLLLAMPGLVMGARERRLSLYGMGAVGLFWVIGASIAVWYSNPLY